MSEGHDRALAKAGVGAGKVIAWRKIPKVWEMGSPMVGLFNAERKAQLPARTALTSRRCGRSTI